LGGGELQHIRNFVERRQNTVRTICAIALLSLSACTYPDIQVRPKLSPGEAINEGPYAYYARGKSELENGRLGLAIKNFLKALTFDMSSVPTLNALGVSYDRLGRFDLAMRYYHAALKLDPASVQTNNNIGFSYLLRGEPELASRIFAQVMVIANRNPVIRGNFERARWIAAKDRYLRCLPAAEKSQKFLGSQELEHDFPSNKLRIVPIGLGVKRLVTTGLWLNERGSSEQQPTEGSLYPRFESRQNSKSRSSKKHVCDSPKAAGVEKSIFAGSLTSAAASPEIPRRGLASDVHRKINLEESPTLFWLEPALIDQVRGE
jgi:tetratricopeptide (TPR) repeat protein